MDSFNQYFINLLVKCGNGDKNALDEHQNGYWETESEKITFNEEFIENIIKLSNDNNANALNVQALMYECGNGFDQNFEKSMELYDKAISMGNPSALNNLFELYDVTGEEQRYNFGDPYEMIIKKCSDETIYKIAELYEDSEHKEHDYRKAVRLYEKLSENGNDNAMYNLGAYYNDVMHDSDKAIKYYEMAIQKNNYDAMNNLGYLYIHDKNNKNISTGIMLYNKAIENNHTNAMNNLALMYENGDHVEQDIPNAIILYKRAIEGGLKEAMVNFAYMLESGEHIEKDYVRAADLFLQADKKNKFNKTIRKIVSKKHPLDISKLTKLICNPKIEEMCDNDLSPEVTILRKIVQFYNKELLKTILVTKKIPMEIIEKEITNNIDL